MKNIYIIVFLVFKDFPDFERIPLICKYVCKWRALLLRKMPNKMIGRNGYLARQANSGDIASKMELVIYQFQNKAYDCFSRNCLEGTKNSSLKKYLKTMEDPYPQL